MLLSKIFRNIVSVRDTANLYRVCILGGNAHRNDTAVAIALFFLSVMAILWTSHFAFGGDIPEAIVTTPSPNSQIISCEKPASEIFEISTRHLPDRFSCIDFERPNVQVNKWHGNGWRSSTVDEAMPLEGNGVLTILYIHGNFMERNNSLERVRIVDSYLKQQADRPYRLLMLSWPSQREKKPLRDVFENAESSECHSLYVAWMLRRLKNDAPVSVLAFSFGARAATGGLHLNAGGIIPGLMAVPESSQAAASAYRLGLVAPAIDRDWIETNGRHNLAMSNVDSLVNLYNSKDPILRRFRFMDRIASPIAAGFAGFQMFADPRATAPLSGQQRIRQYDCGSVIGTTHAEKSYYGECPYFRSVMIQHLLWKDNGNSNPNACIVP